MKKELVLVLDIDPSGGGTFQYALSLLRAVCSADFDHFRVNIIYYQEKWKKYILSLNNAERIQSFSVDHNLREKLVRKLFRSDCLVQFLRYLSRYLIPHGKILDKINPELVIYPSQRPYSYEVPGPNLVAIHDLMHKYESRFPEIGSRRAYRWREFKYRNICKYSEGILVDSELGKCHVKENYSPHPAIYSLPFSVPPYLEKDKYRRNFSKNYDFTNEKYFFYPAQFWEHKNHVGLIKAFAKLAPKYPDLDLVLVGSKKNAYDKVKRLIHNLDIDNRINILGYVDNEKMVGLYKNALALVFASFCGPTNIPPIEAWYLGCPVAMADVYAARDYAEGAAIFFDPEDPDSISEAMETLIEKPNLRETLVEKGKEIADNRRQESLNRRLLEIVKEVLNKKD